MFASLVGLTAIRLESEGKMVDKWQTYNPEQSMSDVSPQRATIRSKRWSFGWKFGLFAVLPVVCLCSLFTKVATDGVTNNADWENTADQFMRAMRDGDVERAYAMSHPEAEEAPALRELQELATGSKFVLFDGYRQLELESWEITRNFDGTFATAEGSVIYSGGYTGRWTFTFIREEEEWKVYHFYVWVPWDKMDAFNRQ